MTAFSLQIPYFPICSVIITTLVAIVIYAERWYFFKYIYRAFWNAREQTGASLLVAGCAMIAVSEADSIPLYPAILTLIFLLLIAVYDASDCMSFRYFGTSILDISRHLQFRSEAGNLSKGIRAYFQDYFPGRYFSISLATVIVLSSFHILGYRFGQSGLLTGLIGVAVGFLIMELRLQTVHPRLSVVEQALLSADNNVFTQRLHFAKRADSFELVETPAPLPRTILIIINESAGGFLPSSDNPTLRFADRLRGLSRNPDKWIVPTNAITNSSCTDVIIPSILTGSAPHESVNKLHQMPFLFDLAKARGYHTAFFTSTTLDWANFNKFFQGANIDEVFTADSTNLPRVNEMGIDDFVVARELAARIAKSEGRLFAVLYSNALHIPFQKDSEHPIPDTIRVRRNRAVYLLEKVHSLLFDTLIDARRFDDALIIVIGDHGEIIGEEGTEHLSPAARLTELHECVLRPLFLLKPPATLPNVAACALSQNSDRLIAHVDIPPTIAYALGAKLRHGLSYAGCNLFEAVPDDRILYVLNVNEWRSWPRSAVGIFRKKSSVIIDYVNQHLSRYQNGNPHDINNEREELLAAALKERLVHNSISRIFRDKLGVPRITVCAESR